MRLVLALLLVAALAQAAPLKVERAPVDLLHAERLDITERFELVRAELVRAPIGSTRITGVEITEIMTPASTYVNRDHWTYSVTLRERLPDGVTAGVFDVRLLSNGDASTVRLVQAVANPLLQEGARVTFDLGTDLPAAQLLVVQVREIPQGPVFELTSAINADLLYVWKDGAQNENPTLELTLGETGTFVVTNGDGTSAHNFQILDGSADPPTTPNLNDLGDQETLTWTPSETGTFVYHCQYHPTMKGDIEVTP